MIRLLLNHLLNILKPLTMMAVASYLLLQFLMFLLSLNAKRILKCSGRSASDFLQKGSFWRGKKQKKVWYLRGPGLTKLRQNILFQAKLEMREKQFRSNAILYDQCTSCIFLYNCDDKYQIDCNGCKNKKPCTYMKENKNLDICNHFKCAKWIEKD